MTADTQQRSGVDPFASIVCGIDGSDESIEAARQAGRLATPGAELTLVGIVNDDAAVAIGWPAVPIAGATKVSREAIEAGIERARRELPGHLVVRHATVTGPPAPFSVVEARAREATLIAVGSHGHGRMAGIMLGSVATSLLHNAPCPVLLTRAAGDDFPRSIVVGIDGSHQSQLAAAVGAELARRTGASLEGLVAMGGAEVDFANVRSVADENGGFPVEDDERDPVD
ncbi:MAG TPA: universal stress protein, partial [Gaiellales bacterium]|nr:universal stress protein [Gaiellales bacterium]